MDSFFFFFFFLKKFFFGGGGGFAGDVSGVVQYVII